MGRVLIISSQVASSRVGASAGRFVLERLGHEVVVLPTVLLGRHPGWGAPGGGAIATDHLRSMWDSIAAQELTFDAILTGYFANTDQIDLARSIITTLNPDLCLVDPVIGDHGQLYVPQSVAEAIRDTLIPLAHLITPNDWEHEWLTADALIPAGVNTLITSYADGEKIGALYKADSQNLRVSHEQFDSVPHGGGDTLAALWLAHALDGISAKDNLARSVGSVLALLRHAVKTDAGEIALVRCQDDLLHPEALEVHHV